MMGAPRTEGAPHVETFPREDGLYDWRMVGANGEKMCGTVQGFTTRADAERGWHTVEEAITLAAQRWEMIAVVAV